VSTLKLFSEIYTMSTRRFGFPHVGAAHMLLELGLDDFFSSTVEEELELCLC
jgi:hypothetical protein